MLQICLFGTLQVTRSDGVRVSFPTHSTAALAAWLALNQGRRMSRAVLAEKLWPDRERQRAGANLRVSLTRLRSALGPDAGALRTEHGELWLEATNVWVDVERFRSAGDLTIVIGPLLEGWDEEWVEPARNELHLLVLDALAQAAQTALDNGQPDEALGLAARLVSADPLREDGHRLVMAAHLSSGRPLLALRQYQVCRNTLDAELGVEVAPETRELARQARARTVEAAPAASAGPVPHMIGRETELAALLAILGGNRPYHTLITGEPGVGKSTLLSAFCHEVRARRIAVLSVSGTDGPAPPPYQLLADLLRSAGVPFLRTVPEGVRAGLALLLPQVGMPHHITPAEDRLRIVNAFAAALEIKAGGEPLLIVVEDLHWADPASIVALSNLLPQLEQAGVHLTATCRSDALAERPDLAALAERGHLNERLLILPLQGLTVTETAALAEVLGPGLSPLLSGWLHQETLGNPLFVKELVQAARQQPSLPPESTPPALHRILTRRFLDLPTEARELLLAGAVLGLSFSPEEAGAMLGWEEEALLAEVDGLLSRGVLIEEGAVCRFYHARFREAVLKTATAAHLRGLHRRASRLVRRPSVVAHHAEAGEDWERAAQALRDAGNAAALVGALTEAADLLKRSLSALAHLPEHPLSAEAATLLDLEGVLGALAHHDEQGKVLDQLDRLAARLGESGLASQAALRRARFLDRLGRHGQAEVEAERSIALAATPSTPATCLVEALEVHAFLAWTRGRTREWLHRSRGALAAARKTGDLKRIGRCLYQVASACHYRGRYEEMYDHAVGALDIARRTDDQRLAAEAQQHIAWNHLIHGETDQALRVYEDSLAAVRRLGDRTLECFQLYLLGTALCLRADWAGAASAMEQGVALAEELQNPKLRTWSRWGLARAQLGCGEASAALLLTNEALRLAESLGSRHDVSSASMIGAQARMALGHQPEAEAWALLQRPAEPGRTPYTSLMVSTRVTEIWLSSGRRDLAQRWARWTRHWREFLRSRVPRYSLAESLMAEASAMRCCHTVRRAAQVAQSAGLIELAARANHLLCPLGCDPTEQV